MSVAKLPERIIITDDPLRARVLVSHHLEYAVPLVEQGDFFVFTGSYKDVPIAVVSTGIGNDNVTSRFSEMIDHGATEVFYIKAFGSKNEFHAASLKVFEMMTL